MIRPPAAPAAPCPHEDLADRAHGAVCRACGEALDRDQLRRRRQIEHVAEVRRQLHAKDGDR